MDKAKLKNGDAHQVWTEKKVKDQHQIVADDGTESFFWRAHTITVLIVLISVLVYESIFVEQVHDESYNIKRGLIACASFFVLFGVTQTPDGPFIRPHPGF
jgi:phosphatidylserine synthase 2